MTDDDPMAHMLTLTAEVRDLQQRLSAMEGHLVRLLSIVARIAEGDRTSDGGT
jgi:hypothetical protein